MGYQRPLIRLQFDESNGDLAGFQITLRRMSVGEVQEVSGLADGLSPGADNGDMGEKISRALDVLARHIVDWNLEDEFERPIEPTREALNALDIPFVTAVLSEWMTRVTGVSSPLPTPSGDGEQFPEVSIPMELPSLSLTS